MEKLIDLGFEHAATAIWRVSSPPVSISIKIEKYEEAENILYAVIFHSAEMENDIPCRSEVVYIGHTRKTFRNRMNGYQAGCGNAVNNRVHEAIKAHLSCGGTVSVMVLPNRHGLQMHGILLDVAAGLEYSLIDYYCCYNRDQGHRPLFNIAGNKYREDNAHKSEEDAPVAIQLEAQEENTDYAESSSDQDAGAVLPGGTPALLSLPCSFTYQLTQKTYWPLSVFNVPSRFQKYFGSHGDVLQVELTGHKSVKMQVYIDRNANQVTHTPRIYFCGPNRALYENWKRENHAVGDTVTVEVVGRNRIRLF
jgi:hypothetical protein